MVIGNVVRLVYVLFLGIGLFSKWLSGLFKI